MPLSSRSARVGPGAHERVDGARVVARDGGQQRRAPERVAPVERRARRHQLLDEVGVAAFRGLHDRRPIRSTVGASTSAPASISSFATTGCSEAIASASGVPAVGVAVPDVGPPPRPAPRRSARGLDWGASRIASSNASFGQLALHVALAHEQRDDAGAARRDGAVQVRDVLERVEHVQTRGRSASIASVSRRSQARTAAANRAARASR